MDRRTQSSGGRGARGLSVVGLFAGVGGLELGFERAGHRTSVLCELMPEARAVLEAAKRRPNGMGAFRRARIVADVTSRELEDALPKRFDVLAGGFPCQDLSQAGRTSGIQGSRSGLIGHVFDLIERRDTKNRPRWIVLENVSFMRHLAGGHAMEVVLSRLSSLGYSWAYREINTLAFGLPQRRSRLFIVACQTGRGDPRRVLLEGDEQPPERTIEPAWRDGRACGFYWTEGNRGVGWADDAVPTLKGGSSVGIPSPPAIVLPGGKLITPHIRDAERLQGFPRGWTEPAAEVDGRGGRSRWQLVGNAVSVPIAEWIGRRLCLKTAPLDLPTDVALATGEKWPSAAWQMEPGGKRYSADVGDRPIQKPHTPLLQVLSEEDLDRRPLSAKAAAGFLGRFESSNLLKRYPAHRTAFLGILRDHVAAERT
ncbi:MAG: DNA cytosine methyltransferase [Sandaracinus sp.]|nr:DNA cytosine methyltransferase [Sandaracinus sp.]